MIFLAGPVCAGFPPSRGSRRRWSHCQAETESGFLPSWRRRTHPSRTPS